MSTRSAVKSPPLGEAGTTLPGQTRLRLTGLTRTYGATRALWDFTASFGVGEVVALVGHNGAGKSTLSKLIGGIEVPDAGTLELDGQVTQFKSPQDAMTHGIALVPQKLAIVPTLSVRHNLTLALSGRPDVTPVADQLGLTALLDTRAGKLSPAAQRLVMIGRALLREPKIMILDEPTAAFSLREVGTLFTIVRSLTAQGITVIYVSHRLQEVLDIADRVIGMAQGRLLLDRPTTGMDHEQLADIIAGKSEPVAPQDLDVDLQVIAAPARTREQASLTVTALITEHKLRGVTLELHPGEVVGLTGLIGAGRTSLLNTLWGVGEPVSSGDVQVGEDTFVPRDPRRAIKRGLVYVPEDRQRTSLIPSLTVAENVALTSMRTRRLHRTPLLDRKRERVEVAALLADLDTKPASAAGMRVQRLSGGNQQKAVLARWLMQPADVFLLDEPTEGVDVHARAEIYAVVRKLADAGKAVLLSSSDIEEVVEHSDRVLVMRAGQIVAELSGSRQTIDEVSRACLQ